MNASADVISRNANENREIKEKANELVFKISQEINREGVSFLSPDIDSDILNALRRVGLNHQTSVSGDKIFRRYQPEINSLGEEYCVFDDLNREFKILAGFKSYFLVLYSKKLGVEFNHGVFTIIVEIT